MERMREPRQGIVFRAYYFSFSVTECKESAQNSVVLLSTSNIFDFHVFNLKLLSRVETKLLLEKGVEK